MIEISISRELADAHPGFMAGCAERGHAVSVFDSDGPQPDLTRPPGPRRTWRGDDAAGVPMGDRTPGSKDRTD